jgi:hypothetical protein
MTDFIDKSFRACIIGSIIFIFALAYSFQAYADTHEKIAQVNDIPIYLSDITSQLERTNKSSSTIEEQKSIADLVSKIESVIHDQQEERYHITPDAAEVQREWKEYEPMLKKISDRLRPRLQLTYEALTKVYDKGEDADQVYNELLKDSDLSPESWKQALTYYKSDTRRESLKRQLDQQNLGWDMPLPHFKRDVIEKEMNKVIDKQLIQADPIFAYFKKILPDYYISWDLFGKEYKDEKVDALVYIRNSRDAWWRSIYQQSDIIIIDNRYQKAKSIVLAKPPERVQQEMAQLRIKYAQPVPHLLPTTNDYNVYKSPPKMPVFDKQNVQHLIDTIEEPQHAMILKVGFFGSHMKRTLSKLDGFNLLIQALNKTKIGTLRWFLIQSVLGFSDYDNPDVDNNYWMRAYQEIFNSINLANTPQKMKFCIRVSEMLCTEYLYTLGQTKPYCVKFFSKHGNPINNSKLRILQKATIPSIGQGQLTMFKRKRNSSLLSLNFFKKVK